MPDTYFRWIAKGTDLERARERTLHSSASPRSACWIFDLSLWKPGSGVRDERVLVAFVFNEQGQAIMQNAPRIRFPLPECEGEAAHPNAIIVKTNEPGAYGIGRDVLTELNACILRTRLAEVTELAKAIGCTKENAQRFKKSQRWV